MCWIKDVQNVIASLRERKTSHTWKGKEEKREEKAQTLKKMTSLAHLVEFSSSTKVFWAFQFINKVIFDECI